MKRIILTLTLLLSAVCAPAWAQGSSAAQFLDISPDAASLSLGGSGLTLDAGAFSVWSNPASSALSSKKLAVGAAYGLWQPSYSASSYAAASGFVRIGKSLAVNFLGKYYMHQSYDLTGEDGIVNGSFTPNEMNFALGVSYALLPSLSLGVNLGYVRSDIGAPQAGSALVSDLALQYRYKDLDAALSVRNLGTKISYGGASSYSLPSKAELGLSYTLGRTKAADHRLALHDQASAYLADSLFRLAGGLRYSFKETVYIAGGYSTVLSSPEMGFASVGAGLRLWGVELGACYLLGSSDNPNSGSLLVNLSYSF